MSGQMPWSIPYVRKVLPYVPIPSLSRMIKGRDQLRQVPNSRDAGMINADETDQMAIDSVEKRVASPSDRKDLLGRLIEECETGHDSKGTSMDIVDVQTEAFGFIIAGSHTTAASTTLLLWHLLHTPEALSRLIAEIDTIESRPEGTASYPIKTTTQLNFLQAAITEGFRINPVFTMPLPREVPKGGTVIAGEYIPEGTDVSICNHVLHHDEQVFGPSLERFDPERWVDPKYDCNAYLMPFGSGHRACVGRNIATAEIQKLVVTLLARYEIILTETSKTSSKQDSMPPTKSFGVADLEGQLIVKLKRR